MKRLAAATLLAALVLPLSALPTLSQEAPAGTAKAEEGKLLLDVSKARAKTGRVPNGMGKLGLTRDQKERIYGINEAYDNRVKELEEELAKLKDEETAQVMNVLSDPQRQAYEAYLNQSPARRAKK